MLLLYSVRALVPSARAAVRRSSWWTRPFAMRWLARHLVSTDREEAAQWLYAAAFAWRGADPLDVPSDVRRSARDLGHLVATCGQVRSTTGLLRTIVNATFGVAVAGGATMADLLAPAAVPMEGSYYWIVLIATAISCSMLWLCRLVLTLRGRRPQVWVFEHGIVTRDRRSRRTTTYRWASSTISFDVIRYFWGPRYRGMIYRYTLTGPNGSTLAVSERVHPPSYGKAGNPFWFRGEWWLLGEMIAAAITRHHTGRHDDPRPPWQQLDPVAAVRRTWDVRAGSPD